MASADGGSIGYEVTGGVATVRLNRPERRNAFTFEMLHAWAAALDAAQDDSEVRAIVVTGAGGHFCAGADLDQLAAVEPTPIARKRMLTDDVHQVARAVKRLDKPLIAAIQGYAIGAGLDMALMCDLRLAGRSARLSEGYIKLGLVPGDGGCYFLPRIVGVSTALRMMWTGDFVEADEALRIGLVDQVTDDDDLPGEANELARRIASAPPVSVQMIKRATYQSMTTDLHTSLDLISSHMAIVQSTEDTAAAMAAFRGGTHASFRGR
jgi:enoyl-CoA hydratase/carnithine racemase